MFSQVWDRLFDDIERLPAVQVIRGGLVMMIPVLLIGSFSLMLRSLPLEPWQNFIGSFHSGVFYTALDLVYNGTFGLLSIYMVLSMSFSYWQRSQRLDEGGYGVVFTSLGCFVMSSGFLLEAFDQGSFGVKGMFLAIFCALSASWLYEKAAGRVRRRQILFSDGADLDFNYAIAAVLPCLAVMLLFALVNLIIFHVWGFPGMQDMFVSGAEYIFHGMGRNLFSGLLFVVLSSLLWFTGVHGSDVFDNVSQSLFAEGIQVNAELAAAGLPPTEIVTKTFFDVFVLMGGCGSTLCLLFALILFGRQRGSRNLAELAAGPMLFNINELMVFGLPVVLNPVLFIPFILTPIVCTLTAYAAFASGLVPVPVTTVEWTTPVLWGGYAATGSLWGAALQVFNLAVGTMIYRPFVREYDREKGRSLRPWIGRLQEILAECEENNRPVELFRVAGQGGKFAKLLAADLKYAIAHDGLYVRYQPQFNHKNQCIGAEALLRWEHPTGGNVYPPLIVELAEEAGCLRELEESVVRRVMADLPEFAAERDGRFRVCINVTARSIGDDAFLDFLAEEAERTGISTGAVAGPVAGQDAKIGPVTGPDAKIASVVDAIPGIEVSLEITEQSALLSDHIGERLQRIREMGFTLSIDDFSMGFTSLKYLQGSQFSLVKLDGSMVRDLQTNTRNQDIISSIVHLSHSLSFSVLAEYVETEEQKEMLEGIGCLQYQGYYYSPPVPLEEAVRMARESAQD